MGLVGSHHLEYDPDDLDLAISHQAVRAPVATEAGVPAITSRVCVSAISVLKEFMGKGQRRATAWICKEKAALLRDQAPDDEMCLVRADESPLRYRHRLSVAGPKGELRIKRGPLEVGREHVEHSGRSRSSRSAHSLRIPDADATEANLRARQRAKIGQGRAQLGSSKYRHKAPSPYSVKSAQPRKVQQVVVGIQSGSDSESGLKGLGSDGDLRIIVLVAAEGEAHVQTPAPQDPDWAIPDLAAPPRKPGPDQKPPHGRTPFQQCSHCDLHRHADLHCWKRLTCQCCGKKAHLSDCCLVVCRGCGENHYIGKCQIEAFYTWIRH
ncbi:hypothetical protein PC119_g25317 [Phytophthora cactorum]|nr:hypothetical protein PC119_g25317 [Phytophthora cactorum]